MFEARGVPGGLDALGIAAYKISTEFALSEIEKIREIGIDVRLESSRPARADPRHSSTNSTPFSSGSDWAARLPLGIEGEDAAGRLGGARLHLPDPREAASPIARSAERVLVIGAGNTAIDVATAAKRLGPKSVTIAYRRGESSLPAFALRI